MPARQRSRDLATWLLRAAQPQARSDILAPVRGLCRLQSARMAAPQNMLRPCFAARYEMLRPRFIQRALNQVGRVAIFYFFGESHRFFQPSNDGNLAFPR